MSRCMYQESQSLDLPFTHLQIMNIVQHVRDSNLTTALRGGPILIAGFDMNARGVPKLLCKLAICHFTYATHVFPPSTSIRHYLQSQLSHRMWVGIDL